MRLFFMLLVLVSGQVCASAEIALAEEGRKVLWKIKNVGRGKETVCKTVEVPPVRVAGKTFERKPGLECVTKEWDNVALAVKQPNLGFRVVMARMDTCESLTKGFHVQCIRNYRGNTNGANTPFQVAAPFGYKVYAIRRLGPTPYGRQEIVYSPLTPELVTPQVVKAGREYLDTVIDSAVEELRRARVMSLAFPGKFVADLVRKDVIHNLALIEHMDVVRFSREPTLALVNEVYGTLALNREGAYNLAPSSAAANGLFQIIPQTYRAMGAKYGAARLTFNYFAGTHDHVNAAKTAMVLLDHDLSLLRREHRQMVYENPKLYRAYSASTYNGGPSCPSNKNRNGLCARQMYERFGEFVKNNPNEENRIYVQKMDAVADVRKRFF